jgi:hypothetical protein
LVALFAFPLFPVSLKDAAAAMAPGQWLTIPMRIDTVGAGDIYAFSSDAAWDQVTHQILFIGAGYSHRIWNFLRYESQSDRWFHDPNLPFDSLSAQPSGSTHSYGNCATDTSGIFYFHYDSLYRYNTTTKKWLSSYPNNGLDDRAGSLKYFPEMNGMVYAVKGTVRLFDFSTHAWRTLATHVPMGMDFHNVAQYDPLCHCMILGGGQTYDSAAFYDNYYLNRMDASGKITLLARSPVAIGCNGVAHLVYDGATGNMLAVGADSVYSLDPIANTWTNLGPNTAAPGGVSFSIPEYGVAGFMPLSTYQFRNLVLYKPVPKAGSIMNIRLASHAGPVLTAVPNPFRDAVSILLPSVHRTSLSIYDLSGSKVAGSDKDCFEWVPGALPAGTYFIKASANGQTVVKSVTRVK